LIDVKMVQNTQAAGRLASYWPPS